MIRPSAPSPGGDRVLGRVKGNQPQASLEGRRVVELFAGVGGFRLGLEAAGWKVVWSNQWEPSTKVQHASDCYVHHFGPEGHSNEDIATVPADDVPEHDLLAGGFPCFAAGTMVLTVEGYRPIEELLVGDLVLTHEGRWRPVIRTMRRPAPSTVVLRAQGVPDVVTTDEHPFLTRHHMGRAWAGGKPHRAVSEQAWVAAGDLKPGRAYLSQVLPGQPPPGPELVDWPDDFWWIVGKYLADGWLVSRPKGRVVICANHTEAAEVEDRIRRVFRCTPVVERTVTKFHVTRQHFHDWLRQFGHGAEGKLIPGWVLSLPSGSAARLLEGYLSGDGSPWQGGWRATTVSKALALGVALLAQRAWGVVASVHPVDVPSTTTIEGRLVRQRKQYQVVIPPRNRSAFVLGDQGWKLLRKAHPAGPAEVFNIAVEEDESYVADGAVVHNCQDYSVAKVLSHAAGIRGKKGVLWWQIERLLRAHRPRYLLLENVDRLLKSPASQRGRDFAVMLACLAELGYLVEWRVVNAADYGFPQRRRRVFIVGERLDLRTDPVGDPAQLLVSEGYLARSLPVRPGPGFEPPLGADFSLDGDLVELSAHFGGGKATPFHNAGVMAEGGKVWTRDVIPTFDGRRWLLADVLQPDEEVDECFYVRDDQVETWRYLKGAKREERIHLASGTRYFYTEGAIPFPDPVDRPSRTILTGEGGSGPSRFKHIIATADGRYRRLTPIELERLNGFPDDWTDMGISDARRAFMMGNALVVGLVERIGGAVGRSARVSIPRGVATGSPRG